MRPVEKTARLINNARIRINPDVKRAALKGLISELEKSETVRLAGTQPSLWRIIMRNTIAKLAAAGVMIIIAVIAFRYSGAPIDGASVTFAQITENMRSMPWMHVVVEGAGDRLEGWLSFEQRVLVTKRGSGGEIRYHDGLKQVVQVFNPEANAITTSYTTNDALGGVGYSVLDFPKYVLKLFGESGAEIVQEAGKYRGKDARIYRMSGFLGGMDTKLEMIVAADTNVVLFINQKALDKDGTVKVEATAHFDYPEDGPDDIYEVGVPTSATIARSEKEESEYGKAFGKAITALDYRDDWPEPRDLVVVYWKARAAKDYDEMAILWPGSATWNREVIEGEEPIAYVFGEAQAAEIEGHIFVPYASKDYYEKHKKYSLTMWLTNSKSLRRRYYIVSGN